MLRNLFSFSNPVKQWRPWLYPFLSIVIATTICLTSIAPAQANWRRWLPVLIRGVQVYQLSNMSPRQEIDLGKQMDKQIKKEMRIIRNPKINRYVQRIGQRLAVESARPNLPYQVQVVDNDSINAFATLGGFIYLHSGLIKTATNEAELASVIGHEFGHITGRHLLKQMRQRTLASGIASAAGVDRNTAVALGVKLALDLPRSRRDEFNADERGLKMLTQAGYAPSAMVSFMQKLQSNGRSRVPTILSTHPGVGDRVQSLKRAIASQSRYGSDGLNTSEYRANTRSL